MAPLSSAHMSHFAASSAQDPTYGHTHTLAPSTSDAFHPVPVPVPEECPSESHGARSVISFFGSGSEGGTSGIIMESCNSDLPDDARMQDSQVVFKGGRAGYGRSDNDDDDDGGMHVDTVHDRG